MFGVIQLGDIPEKEHAPFVPRTHPMQQGPELPPHPAGMFLLLLGFRVMERETRAQPVTRVTRTILMFLIITVVGDADICTPTIRCSIN